MIRRYHDFDPYTAVKPIPGVFCKECGNREDNPNHRPPEPVIDWEARALAAEQALTEARAAQAEMEAAHELMSTQFQIMRREKEHGWQEADRIESERDAARAELAALREAVAALHPELRVGPRGLGPPWCDGCDQPYPCPTVIALASPVEPQPTEPRPYREGHRMSADEPFSIPAAGGGTTIDWEARALAAEQALTEARAELAALREAIEREVSEWTHYVSQDCWYTCPAATEAREGETCCNDDAGSECECSTGWRRDRLSALVAAPVEPQPTEPPT